MAGAFKTEEFENDNAIKLSASLSFSLNFITPLLIIIIIYFSFYLEKEAVTNRFFSSIWNGWK
jgi:membrane protein